MLYREETRDMLEARYSQARANLARLLERGLLVAGLVSSAFRERGHDLIVVGLSNGVLHRRRLHVG